MPLFVPCFNVQTKTREYIGLYKLFVIGLMLRLVKTELSLAYSRLLSWQIEHDPRLNAK